MLTTSRSFLIVIVAIASCSLVIAARIAKADEQSTPQSQPKARVEHPKASETTPLGTVPKPNAPRVLRKHPQVSQVSLLREYRPLSMTSTSHADNANETRIQEALDKEVPQPRWQFVEVPLRDVLGNVSEILQVPVDIDVRSLDDAGLDIETPISFQRQGGSMRSALRRMLGLLDLTWVIRDGCLLITTKNMAMESLVIRVYPLPFGYAADAGLRDLIDLIQSSVSPHMWNTVGGQGSIKPCRELRALVVSQTMEVHDEMQCVLQSLHALGLAEVGIAADGSDRRSPIVRIHEVADARVRADLAAKLVELCNGSLAKGGDAEARVTTVGDCIAVQSVSPEFHILAGELIHAVVGLSTDSPGCNPLVLGVSEQGVGTAF